MTLMDHMADQWPYDTITKTYQEPQNMNSTHTTCTVFAILATILIKFQFLTVAALMNCDDFWQSAEHVLMDGRPLLAMASVTASSSRLLPPGNLQQIHFERFDPFLTFLSSGFFHQFSSASYCVDIFFNLPIDLWNKTFCLWLFKTTQFLVWRWVQISVCVSVRFVV